MKIQITDFDKKYESRGDQIRILNHKLKQLGYGEIYTFKEDSKAPCICGRWFVEAGGSELKEGVYASIDFDKMKILEIVERIK